MPTPNDPPTVTPIPDGLDPSLTVEVLWVDLTIAQAAGYTTDREAWFEATMPPICAEFGYTPDQFWALTVLDHARFVTWLRLDQPAPEVVSDGG